MIPKNVHITSTALLYNSSIIIESNAPLNKGVYVVNYMNCMAFKIL